MVSLLLSPLLDMRLIPPHPYTLSCVALYNGVGAGNGFHHQHAYVYIHELAREALAAAAEVHKGGGKTKEAGPALRRLRSWGFLQSLQVRKGDEAERTCFEVFIQVHFWFGGSCSSPPGNIDSSASIYNSVVVKDKWNRSSRRHVRNMSPLVEGGWVSKS